MKPRSLALLLCLALCTGRAGALELAGVGGQPFRLPLASIKAIRFAHTLRQQYDFSCGSAALATLLSQHYAYPVNEQLVFDQMFAQGDQAKIRKEGFSLYDMQRFLGRHGFKADGFELPLTKLLEARVPAIVLLSDQGYQHFVVVKGLAQGRVLVGDPASGTRALTLARFEQMWRNKLLFVIHDHATAPAFNRAADWRAAPASPLSEGINRGALDTLTLPKLGPGDF